MGLADGVMSKGYEWVQGRRVKLIDQDQLLIDNAMALVAESGEQPQGLVTGLGGIYEWNELRGNVGKVKLMKRRMWNQGFLPHVQVEVYGEVIEVVASFEYLGGGFSGDWRPQDNVKVKRGG